MRRRRFQPRRMVEPVVFHALRTFTLVVRGLPSRWVVGVANRVGGLVYHLDRRGRRVGRQNIDVMLGRDVSWAEKRRLISASMRGAVRALAVTLHASPLTPERVRRWVVIPEDVERTLREKARDVSGAVIVSGHLGNWEILLGLASVFRDIFPTTFLFEPNNLPGLDRYLEWLRGSGSGASASRKGGALALTHHVKRGGIAGLLVDRNTRRSQGGIWVPFCGLDACTTPLPAYLARRNDVPVVPIFCLPAEDGRYVIELGPRLDDDVRTDDPEADVREITRRINVVMETMIRRHPEAWNWTLKRFKSRPTKEQGPYPDYSLFDPR